MPRKRTISDAAVLDAALEIVHRSGPDALSFGTLAARTGLAASTLVQRFGTKPAMLQAALARAWDALEQRTAEADAAAGPGRAGAVDLLASLTGQYDADRPGDDHFADQLLVLREDLRDPVLRRRGERWLGHLAEAVARRVGDPTVGPIVVAYWQGLVTVWAFTRAEPITTLVRSRVADLLARLVPPDRGAAP